MTTDPATLTVTAALARDDAENILLQRTTDLAYVPRPLWCDLSEHYPRKWKYTVTPEPALPGVESPYTPGARIMRADEAPEGWEQRGAIEELWDPPGNWTHSCLIEARPPQPATETINVVDAAGRTLPNGQEIEAVSVRLEAGLRFPTFDLTDTIEVLK